MGLKVVIEDLEVTYREPIQINTDASAAIGVGSQLGTCNVRNIEVIQLRLQDAAQWGGKSAKGKDKGGFGRRLDSGS